MSLDASGAEVEIHYRGSDGSIIRSGTLYVTDIIKGYHRVWGGSEWEMVKVHMTLLSLKSLTEDSLI